MPEESARPRGEAEQGVDGSRYAVVPRVLCFLRSGQEVLLLKGAPDKRLWAGRYNGIGGHMERGEDPLQAARREVREETGLEVETLHLAGIVHVSLSQGHGVLLFLFVGEAPGREVRPSAEGSLEWVSVDRLAHLPVVEDLPLLLPRLLRFRPGDSPFWARSYYDEGGRLRVEF
jgi:8-oxo-dGTP diphosphatase